VHQAGEQQNFGGKKDGIRNDGKRLEGRTRLGEGRRDRTAIYETRLLPQGRGGNDGLCGNKCTCSPAKREYSAVMQPIIFMVLAKCSPAV